MATKPNMHLKRINEISLDKYLIINNKNFGYINNNMPQEGLGITELNDSIGIYIEEDKFQALANIYANEEFRNSTRLFLNYLEMKEPNSEYYNKIILIKNNNIKQEKIDGICETIKNYENYCNIEIIILKNNCGILFAKTGEIYYFDKNNKRPHLLNCKIIAC